MWKTRLLAAAVLLGACGGSTPPAPAPRAQVMNHLTTAYVDYAACARDHGLPNLPDPRVDDQGNDSYPPGSIPANGWPRSVVDGCASAWTTVRLWRDQLDAMNGRPVRTAASFQDELRFAACIRQHGFPDYPDPSADGQTTVRPPPGFDKQDLSPAARAAIEACQHA
jgi:hypothetical protein